MGRSYSWNVLNLVNYVATFKNILLLLLYYYYLFNPHHLRGEERERKSKVTAIFARIEEYILFLCSVLSDLCLALSGACLSPVFSLLLAVLCQSTELKCHLSSDRANCIPRVGGLRSPEASMLARVIAYGTWCREIMFMYLMWENSSLLSQKLCSVLDACEISPFTPTRSEPIGDCGVGFNPYDAST